MKKSIVKSFAAFLVLTLIITSLPVAVFAESADHNYSETCCPNCKTAASPAAICKHIYMTTPSCRYVDCFEVHRVDETTLYSCTKCGYSYHESTGVSHYEAHTYVKTSLGIDPATGLFKNKYTCRCGNYYFTYLEPIKK